MGMQWLPSLCRNFRRIDFTEYGGNDNGQSVGSLLFRQRRNRENGVEAGRGKTIVPFATSGMSGIGDSGMNMLELSKDAKVLSGKRFKNSVSSGELKEWAEEWL